MYFQDYDYAVRSGAEKMYQALPSSTSSPTSKILKSNRSNRKREYAARTQFDCSNEEVNRILEEYIFIQRLCVVFLSSFKINRIAG